MRRQAVAATLALAMLLGLGAPGCGRYGPPVRTSPRQEVEPPPAETTAPSPDREEEESEGQI